MAVHRLDLNGPLNQKTVNLTGGQAVLEYGEGMIRISPDKPDFCPQRICIRMGWISRPGQTIVCVPNRMVITVLGPETGPDSIVR